jgi:hypothetical protein
MNVIAQDRCRSPHLSPAELGALLADEEARVEASAATHLDTCTECQARLTTLAADASVWSEAQSCLSGDGEARWQPDTSQIDGELLEQGVRPSVVHELITNLLDTPSHPEMLGRLGRYDIERVIGSGGMGVVLKAHDSELNRPIAIKLLAPHLAHVGAARERFAREGRAAAAVVHEHVVAIYNVESGGPVPFLVMQYVPGRSLEARVSEVGPLGVEEMLRIGIQAASGLAAAHRQGLVHRDVKPANILLENSVERAILTDFGLARAIDDASLTQTGILAGTPHYMSPEQAAGEAIDHRSDLFSLGAVLYFMATGRPPFRGTNAMGVLRRICEEEHRPAWQVNKDVPDELCDVVDRLLEKKPGRRYASADEVQETLADLLARAQRYGLGRRRFRSWRGRRARWKLAWAAVAATVCVVAISGVHWFQASTSQPAPAAATDSLERALQLRQMDAEFFNALDAAAGELDAAPAESRFLQGIDESWGRELETIERQLDNLESKSGQVPD